MCVGVTTSPSFKKSIECKRFLNENAIPFAPYLYPNEQQYPNLFTNLSSCFYGLDQKQFSINNFPLVLWAEEYDNGLRVFNIAFTVDELKICNLITHKDLISNG